MPPKMHSSKAAWIVAAAVCLILLLLIVLFVSNNRADTTESIVLPSSPVNPSPEDKQDEALANNPNSDFVTITNQNVATVLQTLSRPTAYYQSYSVTVESEGTQNVKTVELWANKGLLHAEVSDGLQTQSIVTDGQRLYLWYDDAKQYVSLELPQGVAPEDILGLPDFDAFLKLSQAMVLEADYLLLEEPQIQCIYVAAKEAEDIVCSYWVNLENGLMYQAEAYDGDRRVYSVVQTDFDFLAVEDERFSDRFLLPDGTLPFTEETETQQP